MWNLFLRLGMVMSTLLVGKQFMDHFWPGEIHPTRLYRVSQIARYLGTNNEEVMALVQSGRLNARWVNEEPLVLGVSILDFLTQRS